MSENQIDESRFMISDKDLMRLEISPELRTHMGLVLYRVRGMFLTIYSEMKRILNTPREQLVEIARETIPTLAEKIVEEELRYISMALDFLRSNQREIYIASIPIQGISIYRDQVVLTTVTVPKPRGFPRSSIYDVFPSQCTMLFHPVSFYVPENYLGSAIVDAISRCITYASEEFDPFYFRLAMWKFSEMARPRGVSDIRLDKIEARNILSDLRRKGVLLVSENYLYDKILYTKHLSKPLLEKSLVESIPPIR